MAADDYARALDAFLASPASAGWRDLPFFTQGAAAQVVGKIDARIAAGARVLPAPREVFNALALTPFDAARVVILGQDPYPTPGHAHGLAFSYLGNGALPASLRNIFKELASDYDGAPRMNGDLSDWAAQGVLLLNPALTVEAGKAGAHLRFGWQALTRDILDAMAARARPAAFILWGDKARALGENIDRDRHLVIESPHPSPLSARRGFVGSRPFSRVNDVLIARGDKPIAW